MSESRARWLLPAVLTLAPAAAPAQEPPTVVSMAPANGQLDVDSKEVTQLVVTFDQAMGQGRSVVGGGPNFPKITGVKWKNSKTFVIDVELDADQEYRFGLNSHTFTNFRSARGVALEPVAWTFTTLPTELRDPREQKKRNKAALDELQKVMARRYSYYDLRVDDWRKEFKAKSKAILASPTDASWAGAVARTLESAGDLHVYLRLGNRHYATARRAVDPLIRTNILGQYLTVKPAGNDRALHGRTEDGIGYLMTTSWTDALDMDAIEDALDSMRDCRAMIVDARVNSGGNELLAIRIAEWFVEGKKVYARNRYRERAGKNGFGRILDRTITGHTNPEERYTGPVALLTSRYAMSSNEAFVLMMRQAPDCVQVGQPTYGSSGNPKPHELSNGVTIVLPSWQALRPDGTCFEGEGIAPDVVVEATADDLKTRDPILERGLELLREKLAKSPR